MSVLDTAPGVETHLDPAPAEARRAVADALAADALVTLFGTCTVDYEGRASSWLEAGDRLVMLKPDGTALVHTDEGHQPVNWQPPGSEHAVAVEDGAVVIRSDRRTPEEHLEVRFERLRQVSAFDVTDPADLTLTGTHDNVRDRILDDPDLVEPGFHPVEAEYDTSAGAVDVFGEDAEGRPTVVEIKRSRAGPEAVGQLRRYVDALERDLDGDAAVRGVLVAPSATERARGLLESDGFGFVSLAPEID